MAGTLAEFVNLCRRRAGAAVLPPPTPPGFFARADVQDHSEMIAPDGEAGDIGGIALAIEYLAADGAVTRRRITCRRLDVKDGNVCLLAWCHERRALRSFRFDRIREIVDWRTGEVIEPPARFLEIAAGWAAADALAIIGQTDHPEPASTDQQLAMGRCRDGVRVLTFLARCDGQFHETERQVIADYCDARGCGYDEMRPLSFDLDQMLAYADRQYPDADTFIASAERIVGAADTGRHVKMLLRSANQLIAADGEISDEEFRFGLELQELARQQGF